MMAAPEATQVLDDDDNTLYEGSTLEKARDYAYRLLLLGTHDLLHIREPHAMGVRRMIVSREQAHRWFTRKRLFNEMNFGNAQAVAAHADNASIRLRKEQARWAANVVSTSIAILIAAAAFQSMIQVLN